MKDHSETWNQKQLIQWCKTKAELQYLFHIPNESVGGQGWIIRNRQMGVKPGVPDLFYPVPLHGYHGMFIEMKAGKGRTSPEQDRWLSALKAFGYKTVVAHGWEEAKEALEEYIYGAHKTKNHATNSILPDGGSEDLSGMRVRPAEEETADMAQ